MLQIFYAMHYCWNVKFVSNFSVIAAYIANTRETTASAIHNSVFTPSLVKAVCVCKFVGTSFGVDTVSVMRKMMVRFHLPICEPISQYFKLQGSHAMFAESKLGSPSFVCNATCAAEGDNTIMELKVVGDLIKGGINVIFPLSLVFFSFFHSSLTRYVFWVYLTKIAQAFYLGKSALNEGQLLRDIAWARAHLLLLKDFRHGKAGKERFSKAEMESIEMSYADVLVKFPVPPQF